MRVVTGNLLNLNMYTIQPNKFLYKSCNFLIFLPPGSPLSPDSPPALFSGEKPWKQHVLKVKCPITASFKRQVTWAGEVRAHLSARPMRFCGELYLKIKLEFWCAGILYACLHVAFSSVLRRGVEFEERSRLSVCFAMGEVRWWMSWSDGAGCRRVESPYLDKVWQIERDGLTWTRSLWMSIEQCALMRVLCIKRKRGNPLSTKANW